MSNRAVMLTLGYAGLLPFYGFLGGGMVAGRLARRHISARVHYLFTRYSVLFSRYLMGSRAVV